MDGYPLSILKMGSGFFLIYLFRLEKLKECYLALKGVTKSGVCLSYEYQSNNLKIEFIMKKTVFAILMAMCITSVSFAKEVNLTTTGHSYDHVMTTKTTPFCMAIVKGDFDTVKKLIELGSDINQKSHGMTPLMFAARYNRTEIIKLLIKKGANIKAKDDKGNTAIKIAKLSNAKEAIALLEELS